MNTTLDQSLSAEGVTLLNTGTTREELELRILILAPIGQDGPLTLELIRSARFAGEVCRGVFDVCHKIEQGCGTLVLAEEALATSSLSLLVDCLRDQPSWSDLPLIVVTSSGDETAQSRRVLKAFGGSAHLSLVERPFRRSTLLSALDVALRSRKRQYAVRDLLAEQACITRSLARSEESLRMAIEATQLGTWDYNPVTGDVLWSATCKALFGLPPNAVVTHETFLNLVHPEDRQRIDEMVRAALEEKGTTVFEAEYRIKVPEDSGTERWVRASGRTYSGVVNGERRVVRFLGTAQDITRRKRTEESLRQQNERLELLSDALSHLLQAQRPEEMVRYLYKKVANHLGVDAYINFLVDEDRSKLRLFSAEGVPKKALEAMQELAFGEAIAGNVAELRRPFVATHIQDTADPKAALAREWGMRVYACNPLMSGERLIGTLSFASRSRDSFTEDELQFIELISHYVSIAMDRARTEEVLRAANENLEKEVLARTAKLQETVGELEAFSYSITHDMRAPLRAMQGFAIALEEESGSLTAECRDYVRRIVNSANRMDQLITDVLNYSRSLRADVPLRVLDFGALTRGIIESYPQFQGANVHIRLDGPFPKVMANEAALTQCISNLLNNGAKFVAPGTEPRIRVWAEPREGATRFWFEDNGIGIRPEYREKIWGLFQKLNRGYDGTGLGLAIVKKAVERMGGSVGVESEWGKGSRFWLELQSISSANQQGSGAPRRSDQGHSVEGG